LAGSYKQEKKAILGKKRLCEFVGRMQLPVEKVKLDTTI
jgi:hypothetical protein